MSLYDDSNTEPEVVEPEVEDTESDEDLNTLDLPVNKVAELEAETTDEDVIAVKKEREEAGSVPGQPLDPYDPVLVAKREEEVDSAEED